LHVAALASLAIILFLIVFSLTVTAKNDSHVKTYVYIANSGDDTVSVIDTATDTVIHTVSIGSYPCAVAVTPDGSKVYVASLRDNAVYVFDTATNTIITRIYGMFGPWDLSVTPDGREVYVANKENPSPGVAVINTTTNTVETYVRFGYPPDMPYNSRLSNRVTVTPDGSKVYVASDSEIYVIDTATKAVTPTGLLIGYSQGIAITPDGKKAYVANTGEGTNVSVINTKTNTVKATINLGSTPSGAVIPNGIAISPNGKNAYVTRNDGTVSIIDTATDKVKYTVICFWGRDTGTFGNVAIGVALTPDGKKVYVICQGTNNVFVIDAGTNTIKTVVPVGSRPIAVGQFIGSIPVKK
jgi:YVTN family beta-propeller protein